MSSPTPSPPPRSPAAELASPARGDVGEEDVRCSVLRLRARQAEDGTEAGLQSCQSLVLPESVLRGGGRGAEVCGSGDVDLPPGRAAVLGAGEPQVSCGRCVAGSVVA